MTTTFEILGYSDSAKQVVKDVFQTMLHSTVSVADGSACVSRSKLVTAAIFFHGQWEGGVAFECSEEQSTLFASRLMNIPRPDGMDDDACDAMGELANMIGGNLKSILPKGIALSLPRVLTGGGHVSVLCEAKQSVQLFFADDSGPFTITLFKD